MDKKIKGIEKIIETIRSIAIKSAGTRRSKVFHDKITMLACDHQYLQENNHETCRCLGKLINKPIEAHIRTIDTGEALIHVSIPL
jgi:hypothetical protein